MRHRLLPLASIAFALACGPGLTPRGPSHAASDAEPSASTKAGEGKKSTLGEPPAQGLDALVRWLPNGTDAALVLEEAGAKVQMEALFEPVSSVVPSEFSGLFFRVRSLRELLVASAGPLEGPVLVRSESPGATECTILAQVKGDTARLDEGTKPNALGVHVAPVGPESDGLSMLVLSSREVALARQAGVDAFTNAIASSNRGHPVALGGQTLASSQKMLAEAWVLTRNPEADPNKIVSVHARVEPGPHRGVTLLLRLRPQAGSAELLRERLKRAVGAAKGPLAPLYRAAHVKTVGDELAIDVTIPQQTLKRLGP